MSNSVSTGTRIRERRMMLDMKQASLARVVGISPAYLNLIEHNKRKIGGKLLVDLARALSVEPADLTSRAQLPLIDSLQNAALHAGMKDGQQSVEMTRVDEFASRFPGWAALIEQQRHHIEGLEREVSALNDRLAHDPFLSDALHEVLSTVTAIRSTAGILQSMGEIDPDWQARFHRNLYEDSQRLSKGAQALVQYLDTIGSQNTLASAPLEEVGAWLAGRGYVVEELESGKMPDLRVEKGLQTPAGRLLARDWLLRARADAERMPLSRVEELVAQHGPDPAVLAQALGVDLATAMRRLASLPPAKGRMDMGLVTCDGSGAIRFCKPLGGFAPPRFGAACPLWPLYQALLRPTMPMRNVIAQTGQPARHYMAYAICQPQPPSGFDAPQVVEATMLFYATGRSETATGVTGEVVELGTSCRVCPRANCPARREPSMVSSHGAEDNVAQ